MQQESVQLLSTPRRLVGNVFPITTNTLLDVARQALLVLQGIAPTTAIVVQIADYV